MDDLFLLAFFVSLAGLCLGLVSPRLISRLIRRQVGRKAVLAGFGGVTIASFIGFGLTLPPAPPQPVKTEVEKVTVSTSTIAVSGSDNKKEEPKLNEEAAIAATTPQLETSPQKPTSTISEVKDTYPVVHVVDGDTFDIQMNGKKERVRLIGVDTPETVDPRKPVQCFGKEASAQTKKLVEGKEVRIETDPSQGERDKYGRLLVYAFTADGTNVGLHLIAEGFAHEYTYNLPYKYQRAFKEAEAAAQRAKKGLWSDTACAAASSRTTSPSPANGSPAPTTGIIKKSTSNICWEPGSTYYERTKNFTPYPTLQDCLNNGGRLPKN